MQGEGTDYGKCSSSKIRLNYRKHGTTVKLYDLIYFIFRDEVKWFIRALNHKKMFALVESI